MNFKLCLQKMLRNVRLSCGFSQRQVAEVLHMSRSTYTYYECGKTSPDVGTLRALATLYDVPAEIFMFPEKYADMEGLEKVKGKDREKPLPDPQRMSDLTGEEEEIVGAYRLSKEA